MSYINFKGTVKTAKFKADEIEVQLIIPSHQLRGQYENLNDMISCQVIGGLDSQVIKFNKLINAKTDKPLVQYKVDDKGVVSEVKPEGEQLTIDEALGLPPEKVNVKEEQIKVDLAIINDFILNGMGPSYDDLDYDFVQITSRLTQGETYLKLAAEHNTAVMLFTMAIDEYRQRVAPMAMKWDEWRKGKVQSTPDENQPEEQADASDEGAEKEEATTAEGKSEEPVIFENQDQPGETVTSTGVNIDELEQYVLTNKPTFDDIPYDFPKLLAGRKAGKSWMEIAQAINVTSGVLQKAWGDYKKRVSKMMEGPGAA